MGESSPPSIFCIILGISELCMQKIKLLRRKHSFLHGSLWPFILFRSIPVSELLPQMDTPEPQGWEGLPGTTASYEAAVPDSVLAEQTPYEKQVGCFSPAFVFLGWLAQIFPIPNTNASSCYPHRLYFSLVWIFLAISKSPGMWPVPYMRQQQSCLCSTVVSSLLETPFLMHINCIWLLLCQLLYQHVLLPFTSPGGHQVTSRKLWRARYAGENPPCHIRVNDIWGIFQHFAGSHHLLTWTEVILTVQLQLSCGSRVGLPNCRQHQGWPQTMIAQAERKGEGSADDYTLAAAILAKLAWRSLLQWKLLSLRKHTWSFLGSKALYGTVSLPWPHTAQEALAVPCSVLLQVYPALLWFATTLISSYTFQWFRKI